PDARRVGRLLPGLGAARLDAVDRGDLAGDLRLARRPRVDPERHRHAVGGRLAAARDRRVLDPDRAPRVQGRGAVREEAREAEEVRVIELRVASSSAELETWAELKSAVVPNEPVTAEQLGDSA